MTQIDIIYDIFLSQIDDELFALLRPSIARRELNKYLIGSISKFRNCKKDLKIQGYGFSSLKLGVGEYQLSLPKDHLENIEIIGEETGIEYKKGIDWDVKDELIEFESPLSEPVEICFYNNGYFETDLTFDEMFILAQGMIFYWLHPKLNREDNLRQLVTDSDFKKLSGANMLDKVIKLYENTKNDLESNIIAYSYKNIGGFN
ncbi:Uncharacterised protein [Peptostreptococcus anaerobius]|uniref:Uncharacterized protein n=1 Tax=Peptostreptococcus anaerobius TaxID=1261 RepID=A0A379CJD2_9FIRM|nr:hypothetical protein [Peptostreptococcus anaerobius]SFM87083.1 hypothetical protein SAMN05660467_00651 [Peptostreptococcus anaerobius]SUB60166.1 Uncharacterised protein [Peptostreptococcus anaerobius]SUB62155.1 Uncharacterised protein [Peptostreptococcus anaerobius]SUB62169.1 Uncharacterised protein [Peptostreptococcus anaerobius]SUB62173.1 Uncharacterised protein [Peptostreptococcus anaerobius]